MKKGEGGRRGVPSGELRHPDGREKKYRVKIMRSLAVDYGQPGHLVKEGDGVQSVRNGEHRNARELCTHGVLRLIRGHD